MWNGTQAIGAQSGPMGVNGLQGQMPQSNFGGMGQMFGSPFARRMGGAAFGGQRGGLMDMLGSMFGAGNEQVSGTGFGGGAMPQGVGRGSMGGAIGGEQDIQQMGRNPLPGGIGSLGNQGGGMNPWMQKPMMQPQGMQHLPNFTGMSREQTLAGYGQPQTGGRQVYSEPHGGMHPYLNSSPPPVPQMPTNGLPGPGDVMPPPNLGGATTRNPTGDPRQNPLVANPWNPGGESPFGPIVPPPNLGGATTRNPTGDPRQNPLVANPWMGGSSGSVSGGGFAGTPGAMGGNSQNMGAMGGGQSWDGFSSIDLSQPAGSMALNFDPSGQGLDFNGLRASLTQLGPNAGHSDAAKFWVQGADGSNLGSLDQLGRTNGLDLQGNLKGAKLNWSGLGAGGARLQGNGRRY